MDKKKILMSLSVIGAATAALIGGTGAFFSDTETSTGNTFTAGAIDLKVDSQQHYNGNVCVFVPAQETQAGVIPAHYAWQGNAPYPKQGDPCDGTWSETDLGAQKFFNFGDVKPGDSGEDTISLHVVNNDAWACVDVNLTKNDDMSSTEPELDGTGDVQDIPSELWDGELAQNVYFTAWADDGDNVWEKGEPLLFSNQKGPASDVLSGKTYALADSTTGGGPLAGGVTRYIGLAWCAGNMTLAEAANTGDPNTIGCGTSLGNIAQTDSFQGDISFRVVQSRNNPTFVCSPLDN